LTGTCEENRQQVTDTRHFQKKHLAGAILHYTIGREHVGGNFFKKIFGGNFSKNI
jgi:hypothetical protein